MDKRRLGNTGERLSLVGFGGIVVNAVEPAEAGRLVAEAIERGVNYFDVAPSYGNAEERLGPALRPYRQDVFLACKTTQRARDGAWAELRQSLRYLQTDHFDLYQLHGVSTEAEVEQIMAPAGAIEAFLEARRQGLIRFIGFSAHTEEAALALLDRFLFDSVLFPFNWVCWRQSNFGPRVLTKAGEKGAGALALKALARRTRAEGEEQPGRSRWYWTAEDPEEAEWALRFTLSLPITSAVSPGDAELLWWMCDAADRFRPLSEEEEEELGRRSAGLQPLFPLTR